MGIILLEVIDIIADGEQSSLRIVKKAHINSRKALDFTEKHLNAMKLFSGKPQGLVNGLHKSI